MILAHRRPVAVAARDGERGAVIVLVAICLSVLVTATAFTVDLGRVSTENRSLQKVADVTALDLSRRLDGRTASQIVADPAWQQSIDTSLERNGFVADGTHTASVAIGTFDVATEAFTPSTGSQVPTAVRVVLDSEVDYAFAPGGSTPTRTAVAGQSAAAGQQIGSFAARLDTQQSPLLGALVGDALGVTVAGYDGLAGANVVLGDLVDELSLDLGDVDGLATAEVSVAELLGAEAEVLRRSGEIARASILDALILDLPDPDELVRLADLLVILPGGDAAAALASIDAADLLNATALVANGTNLLDIPVADINVAGQLATVSTSIQVIEKPRWVFGPVGSTARTAQATIELELGIVIPGVSDTRVTLHLQAASAEATSTAIGCRTPQLLDLDVRTGLLTTRAEIETRLSVLNIPVADVELHAATSAPPDATAMQFDVPPDVLGEPRQAPTPATSIGSAAVVTDRIDILGLPVAGGVEPLVSALTTTVLTPLLTTVETTVLQPLADALGLTVAGADVAPLAIACSGPKLLA